MAMMNRVGERAGNQGVPYRIDGLDPRLRKRPRCGAQLVQELVAWSAHARDHQGRAGEPAPGVREQVGQRHSAPSKPATVCSVRTVTPARPSAWCTRGARR